MVEGKESKKKTHLLDPTFNFRDWQTSETGRVRALTFEINLRLRLRLRSSLNQSRPDSGVEMVP